MILASKHKTLQSFSDESVIFPAASHPQYAKTVDRLRNVYINRIEGIVRAHLAEQTQAVVREARDAGSIGAVQGLAIQAAIRNSDARPIYEKTYITVVPVFADRVYRSLGGKRLKQTDDVMQRWLLAAQEFIDREGGILIREVASYTQAQVEAVVRRLEKEALEGKWSVSKITDELLSELTTLNRHRARTIARTETMRSSSVGSREGAASTGLELNKEWLTGVKSDRHPTYPGLNGQIRAFNEPYDVGGHPAMYPQDPDLPAEESINCVCSEAYLPI